MVFDKSDILLELNRLNRMKRDTEGFLCFKENTKN